MKAKLPGIVATLFLIAVVAVALWQIPRTSRMQQQADAAATLSAQNATPTMNLPTCTYGKVLCTQNDEVIVNYYAHSMCTWQEFEVGVGQTHAVTSYSVVRINGPSFPNWASLVIGSPSLEYYISGIKGFQVQIDQPDTCKLRTVLGFAQQWGLLIPDELRQLGILSGPTFNP